MTYMQALQVAQKAAKTLEKEDGNLSTAEVLVHMAALAVAAKTVEDHITGCL